MRSQLGMSVIGAGLGAGLMFLLDPEMGRRRRAIARDKAFSLMKTTGVGINKTARDIKNRAYGTVVSAKSGRPIQLSRLAILQRNWPPAIRLMMGTAGFIAGGVGVKKGGIIGSLIGTVGAGLAALAITNLSVRELFNRIATIAETQMPERLSGLTAEGSEGRRKQQTVA